MGKLVTETPFSEITAMLEILDRFGIEREDLTRFRKAAPFAQMGVVHFMKHGEQKPPPNASIEVVGGVTHIIITPTTGPIYRSPIIMGTEFSDDNRSSSQVRKEAERRGYRTMPFEAARIFHEALSDEDLVLLGLCTLIGMCDPAFDRNLFLIGRDYVRNGHAVGAGLGRPNDMWGYGCGFAFLAPQV
jgi:hypothetical protein